MMWITLAALPLVLLLNGTNSKTPAATLQPAIE